MKASRSLETRKDVADRHIILERPEIAEEEEEEDESGSVSPMSTPSGSPRSTSPTGGGSSPTSPSTKGAPPARRSSIRRRKSRRSAGARSAFANRSRPTLGGRGITLRGRRTSTKTIFDELEAKGDVHLDLDEFVDFMRSRGINGHTRSKAGRAQLAIVKQLFAEMDADGDGSLTMLEILSHLCSRYFVHTDPIVLESQGVTYEAHAAAVADISDANKALEALRSDERYANGETFSYAARISATERLELSDRGDVGIAGKIAYLLQDWDVQRVVVVVIRRSLRKGVRRRNTHANLPTAQRLARFGTALEATQDALALLFDRMLLRTGGDKRVTELKAAEAAREEAERQAELVRTSAFADASFDEPQRSSASAAGAGAYAPALRPAWVVHGDMRSLRNPTAALQRAIDVVALLLDVHIGGTVKEPLSRQLMLSRKLAARMDALPRSAERLRALSPAALVALCSELERPVKFSEGLLGDLRAWLRDVHDAVEVDPLLVVKVTVAKQEVAVAAGAAGARAKQVAVAGQRGGHSMGMRGGDLGLIGSTMKARRRGGRK